MISLSRDSARTGGTPLAFLAMLGGNAALAFGPAFVRAADVGPVAAAFWRLALALPVLLVFAMWQWRRLGHTQTGAPIFPGRSASLPGKMTTELNRRRDAMTRLP